MEDRGNKSHTKKVPNRSRVPKKLFGGQSLYKTWSQGAHPVVALGRQRVVSIQYWCLSEPCTKPGRVYRVICTKIQLWEITPHIATSIPRQTSSGTKSVTSGISETFSTECSLIWNVSLSVYNTALSDLRCERILSSTYWTGAVDDIFISQISQWQKWVGRKWKRSWMSEKYEKQQFVFRNLVCDWFSHNGHKPADAECKVL